MNRVDAEEYSQSLGQISNGAWRQILLAKKMGVPKTLNLSLPEWVEKYIGGYIRQPIEERREAVLELETEGLTERETAEVLGTAPSTVHEDRKAARNRASEKQSTNPEQGKRTLSARNRASSPKEGVNQQKYSKPDDSFMGVVSTEMTKYPPQYVARAIATIGPEYARIVVNEIKEILNW